jgi:hypothetical protein
LATTDLKSSKAPYAPENALCEQSKPMINSYKRITRWIDIAREKQGVPGILHVRPLRIAFGERVT